MNKKKSRKRTNLTPNRKLINIFLTIFLIAFLVTIASYFTIKNKEANKDIPPQVSTQEIKDEISIPPRIAEIKDLKEQINHKLFEEKFDLNEEHKFEEYTKELEKVIDEKTEVEESINKENKIIQKKVEEIKEDKLKEKQKEKSSININETIKNKIDEKSIITKKDTFTYDKKIKPKIAIVIDDVTTQAQKDKILSMGYKINMAFLPPTKTHPDSAKIAQSLSFHMIHFPMQASSAFKGEEINTLTINDSYETIEKELNN